MVPNGCNKRKRSDITTVRFISNSEFSLMKSDQEYIERASQFYPIVEPSEERGLRPSPPDLTPDRPREAGKGDDPLSSRSIGLPPVHVHELPINSKQAVMFTPTANLGQFEAELFNDTSECKPRFIVTECKCGRKVFPQSCMKLSCLKCNPFVRRRRAQSIFYRFVRLETIQSAQRINKSVIYTVFTIPMRLRIKFKDPKQIRLLRSKLWTLLKTEFGGLFGVEGTHPIGDEHPDIFHPHFNFLWMQRPGFRAFINEKVLKKKFAKILRYNGQVNAWTQYSNERPQIWKWADYVARIWANMSKWCGYIKWYGRYPKYVSDIDVVCGSCGHNYTALGFIDCDSVESFELFGWKSGRDPPWYNDDKITFFKRFKNLA